MRNKIKQNKFLAEGIGLLLAVGLCSMAMAGKGTKTITSVIDNSDSSYFVVLDSTTGITVGDHFGALVADGSGAVYVVASIGTAVRITDTLTEENGGTYGAPVAGSSWYSTPSANVTLSKPPYTAVGWDAPLRRNAHMLETEFGSRIFGIAQITTAAVGDILVFGAGDEWTLLTPGTSGWVVTSNGAGSLPSYQAAAGGTNALLDASAHTDTVAQAVTRGSIVYGNSTPAWDELTIGAANTILGSDGTDASWRTLSATMDGAVSSTQGTLLYRGASTWDGIAPQTSGKLLVTQGAAANPVYYSLQQIMDGEIGSTQGTILYHNGTAWVALATGTSGDVLTTQGAAANPIWSTPGGGTTHDMLSATHTDSTASAVTRGSLIVGNSTPKWIELNIGAANTIVSSEGVDTSFQTLTTLIDGALGNTHGNVLYRNGTVWTVLAPGTNGQVLTSGGAAANVSWAAAGGTNALLDGSAHSDTVAQTVTRGSIIVGNSTPAWDEVTVGADNTVVASDGTDTTFESVTSLLDAVQSSTQGAIAYRNASTWTAIAPQTSGMILTTQGAAANPVYYSLGTHLNDTLGTTQGTVLYHNGTAWVALAVGTNGQVLTSGGAAANPSWTTPGSGSAFQELLSIDSTQTGNVGTGEDTLASYTIAAGKLAANSDQVVMKANGRHGLVGNDELKFKFGATTVLQINRSSSVDWSVEMRITRISSNVQRVYVTYVDDSGYSVGRGATTETDSGTIDIVITGENTTNSTSDAVFRDLFQVTYIDATQ